MSPGGRQRTNILFCELFIMDVSIYPAGFSIFSAWLLAELINRRLLPCTQRYISSPFNSFQRLSTWNLAMALKRVEMFSPATFRIFLDRRPVCKVRRESLGH